MSVWVRLSADDLQYALLTAGAEGDLPELESHWYRVIEEMAGHVAFRGEPFLALETKPPWVLVSRQVGVQSEC